jgi:hypothetical protein
MAIYSNAHQNRGVVKKAKGDYDGAKADFRKAFARPGPVHDW